MFSPLFLPYITELDYFRRLQSHTWNTRILVDNVDLTVELNREQRGQVTAIRYPTTKRIETVPSPVDDSRGATFVSHISHHVQPPPSTTTAVTSRATPISTQPSTSPEPRHRVMPPTTVYRTVDIPFDESPAAYQPKKDENVRTVMVTMGTHPVQKGLGFTITIERGRPTIDSVIVSSPADRAGLLIGDRVISINGEDLKDKYPSAINRMLHEAARLGEAEVCIERKDAKIAQVKSITSVENFDKVRSVFTEKTIDSYAEFKRKHSRGMLLLFCFSFILCFYLMSLNSFRF
ncbi:PDZ/DHR/GLGF domain protein [Cooperia oncophora]